MAGMEQVGKTGTALITGGSRGLGLALARALAEKDWTVIITGRNEKALTAAARELAERTRVIAVPGDVSDSRHRAAVAEAAQAAGGLDVVVNNAGMLGPSPLPTLLNFPLEALEELFRVNAVAPLALLQAVWPSLREGGRVLNITSDAAAEPYPGWGGYGASKAAFEMLSAVIGVENLRWRVYQVDPGDMRTEMHQAAFPGEDISDRPLPEASVPGLLYLIEGSLPSGRYVARDLAREEGVTQ